MRKRDAYRLENDTRLRGQKTQIQRNKQNNRLNKRKSFTSQVRTCGKMERR